MVNQNFAINQTEYDNNSDYSVTEKEEKKQKKRISRTRKKGKKAFQGSEMESELGEFLGANEDTGNFVAKAIAED